MDNGTVRSFFAGGNTCLGFYSLYHNIIQQKDASRIFVIKGGPGVGKSTFMKYIGNAMLEKGYDIEQHWCSSDNNSLDGLVIPKIGVCLLDGTAPHVVDPITPGAVDEIIHLGDHWNEAQLVENKTSILNTFKKVSRCFQTAYTSLKEAKVIHDEWVSYITECIDFRKVNEITHQVIEGIFTNIQRQYEDYPTSRELFASATTPMGLVNQWPSILQNCKKVFVLRGEPGTGKSTIIQRLITEAKSYSLCTEAFRSSFDPLKFSGVYIPKLQTAVINPFPNDYILDGLRADIVEIDLTAGMIISRLSDYDKEVSECRERFWNSINRAINYIASAKKIHDELEKYYVPAMDFSKINEVRDRTLQKIIALT
ncbi:PRK06851 family protein [Desulfitibacter alkalitolerans]|uniref:PRK06851 family protein n=1 Tax=Desulfitibacter alkalitolerans TaxID=264641 RepID=UPI0004872536|nr:PRK06851 family protein [Desulfitibacter alkalitolerans]